MNPTFSPFVISLSHTYLITVSSVTRQRSVPGLRLSVIRTVAVFMDGDKIIHFATDVLIRLERIVTQGNSLSRRRCCTGLSYEHLDH